MQEERDFLWKVRHPELAQKVSEAAAQGDRSENADYTYNKQLLNRTLGRIRYLDKRLDAVKVVDQQPADPSRAYFGAWVTLEDEEGTEAIYRIVGPDETDMEQRWISIDSPVAKALLGKPADTDILVNTPEGEQEYYLVKVSYSP